MLGLDKSIIVTKRQTLRIRQRLLKFGGELIDSHWCIL